MADLEQKPNQYTARFKGFIGRSAMVALRRIAAEAENVPISDEARERAENVLSYTLQEGEAWTATRDLLLTMAPKMEMAGYREKWIEYLQAGVAQSQQQSDRLAEAELLFHCGYLYRLLSKYDQARQLLNASAQLYHTLGAAQNEARALNQLAYLAWQQHHYGEVERLTEMALALVEDMSLEKAMSLSALGLVATDRSHYADAEKYHQEALLIRTKHAAKKEMAWSLQNLGLALSEQGKTSMAVGYYERALSLLDKVQDPARKSLIQLNLGTAYYVQGDYNNALEIFMGAEESLRKIADNFNLAKLLTTKGLCYLALHQGNFAEQAFRASSDLFRQLDDLSWYLNAYDGLGISYLEQEQYDKALAIFESILAQLPEIEGTPAHKYLTTTIAFQIEQAKSKQVMRGKSVYLPPQED